MSMFLLMRRRPPRATRTATLFPDTTRFRSETVVFRRAGRGREIDVESDRARPGAMEAVDSCGVDAARQGPFAEFRSEEHTSELQSLMRISYAVFCLKQTSRKRTAFRTSIDLDVQC